jgi:limonene-1,2-epoxide hydrolase
MKAEDHLKTDKSAREIVLYFLRALNDEDFAAAKKQADDEMIFAGVMGTRNGAEAYFNDMAHMKLKYAIKKVFADGDDVCVFYDITMAGLSIFSCGWYHVKEEKIDSIKVIFDPRPLLEQSAKK